MSYDQRMAVQRAADKRIDTAYLLAEYVAAGFILEGGARAHAVAVLGPMNDADLDSFESELTYWVAQLHDERRRHP